MKAKLQRIADMEEKLFRELKSKTKAEKIPEKADKKKSKGNVLKSDVSELDKDPENADKKNHKSNGVQSEETELDIEKVPESGEKKKKSKKSGA